MGQSVLYMLTKTLERLCAHLRLFKVDVCLVDDSVPEYNGVNCHENYGDKLYS